VTFVKFLGVIIDEELTWKNHIINYFVRKNAMINVICSLITKMKKFEYSITCSTVGDYYRLHGFVHVHVNCARVDLCMSREWK
jgi:hypothetical protein